MRPEIVINVYFVLQLLVNKKVSVLPFELRRLYSDLSRLGM